MRMFGKKPPETDYLIINGKKKITRWVKCVDCGTEIFTYLAEESAKCDECFGLTKSFASRVFKKKKKKIPKSVRWEVWERDNFTCKGCGSRRNLEIDHIYPESKGGTLDLNNLQTLCKSCNVRKGAK